jgi:hypothetical protein
MTAAEHERLQQQLLASPEARQEYFDFMRLHTGLRRWQIRQDQRGSADLVELVKLVRSQGRHGTAQAWGRSAARLWNAMLRKPSLVAAVVLLVCVAGWLARRSWMNSSTLPTVVRAAGAEFAGIPSPLAGTAIPHGELELTGGVLELRTGRGAAVVIEAPARFRWPAAERIELHDGRVSAEVPDEAIGFTIDTADAEVQDLGTRFGVEVRPDGPSQVHVFEGEVNTRLRSGATGAKRPAPQSVRQGESLAIAKDGATIRGQPRPAAFIDRTEMAELAAAWQANQRSRWQAWADALRRDPALVLYADMDPQTPVTGPAVVQCKVEHVQRVQGRWAGRHAVEFTDEADRMLVNLSQEQRLPQATLLAWVRLNIREGRYQTLCYTAMSMPFTRTEPEAIGRFQWSLTRQSAMRLAVVGSHGPADKIVAGAGMPVSRVDAPVAAVRWQHLAVTYDSARRRTVFYVDGRPLNISPLDAAPPLSLPMRMGLGNVLSPTEVARDLSGRLDEFAVLSRILTPAEIRVAHDAGTPYQATKE